MYILIDNYDSFTYIIKHYLQECNVNVKLYRNDKITANEIFNKKPIGIIISPGPKTPKKAGICIDLIKMCSNKIPIFGICLGHQAIAEAYGGKIIRAKNVMHGKISEINHDKSALYNNIPNMFQATRYHSLIVDKKSLPKTLKINSISKDNIIMGISNSKAKAYGVQFHPESIESQFGHKIIKNFINICEKK